MRYLEPFGRRNLLRMDPFSSNIDRVFDEFLSSAFDRLERLPGIESTYSAPFDLEETDNEYLMTADLPGVRKEDLNIEVVDNQLRIRGERKRGMEEEEAEEGKVSRMRERSYGKFDRIVTLPFNIDASKVQANYQDGVLELHIPKEMAQSHKIEISEGRSAQLAGGKASEKGKSSQKAKQEEARH